MRRRLRRLAVRALDVEPRRVGARHASPLQSIANEKNASSCTSTLLFFVSCTGADALPIEPLIGQVFAGGRDPVDVEVTRKVRLDFGAGARLAGLAQVLEHGREQRRAPARRGSRRPRRAPPAPARGVFGEFSRSV